jgi:hypothetical protein
MTTTTSSADKTQSLTSALKEFVDFDEQLNYANLDQAQINALILFSLHFNDKYSAGLPVKFTEATAEEMKAAVETNKVENWEEDFLTLEKVVHFYLDPYDTGIWIVFTTSALIASLYKDEEYAKNLHTHILPAEPSETFIKEGLTIVELKPLTANISYELRHITREALSFKLRNLFASKTSVDVKSLENVPNSWIFKLLEDEAKRKKSS